MYIYVYIYIYIYIYTYTYAYIYIYIHTYTYNYITGRLAGRVWLAGTPSGQQAPRIASYCMPADPAAIYFSL